MKIINKTHWQTEHLKAIISRVAQNELDPKHRKHLVVTVGYNRSKSGHSSGHAYLAQVRRHDSLLRQREIHITIFSGRTQRETIMHGELPFFPEIIRAATV